MDRKVSKSSSDETISNVESEGNKFWVYIFVGIISMARIGCGLFMSLSGPTLLYLADNVHASVADVSAMFTGRSAGFWVGSAIFGLVMKKFPKFSPMLTIALGVALNGLMMVVTPWITNLPGLVVTTTIAGVTVGYMDAAMQSMYLQLWGEEKSRPFVQSFHFAFSVGALLAPVVASPFLQMADSQQNAEDSCPSHDIVDVFPTTSAVTASAVDMTTQAPYTGLHPVAWPYIISGTFMLIIGFIMIVLAILRMEDKVRIEHKMTTEERFEEPLKQVIWLFLPLSGFYFTLVAVEVVYQTYIYSIALCSELALSVVDASNLNVIFWAGFGVGRAAGIMYASFFDPKTMIIFDLIGTTTALIIMSIFGKFIPLVVWFVTFYVGLFVATFYSTGVSWASRITNMSSTYIFVFATGNTIGQMVMQPVAGALFDSAPFSVIYQLLTLSVAAILFYIWMEIAGRRHLQKSLMAQSTFKLADSEIDYDTIDAESINKTKL